METTQESKLQMGQTFPVTIKRLGINGEGVGYFKRQVVFIPGVLPGEEVVAEVTAIKKRICRSESQANPQAISAARGTALSGA
ncbi:hypothetical protein GCM10020331_014190 [Ectobacillus funiculus]